MASTSRLQMHRLRMQGIRLPVLLALLLAGLTWPPPARGMEEVQPPLYYLEDAAGQLRPAPGLTLEDFRRAYDQLHGLGPEGSSPPYVFEKFAATGEAEGHYARFTIHCDLLLRRDGTVRVPLSLGQAVITGGIGSNKGETSPALAFDEASGGYVTWVSGKAGQRRRLTLKALAPVTTVGGRSALHLRIPAATESELTFTVPMARAVAETSEGTVATVRPVEDKRATQWTVGGARGDFELAWHRPEVRATTAPMVLEATGEIVARIDSRGIQSQAVLAVRGHGKPLERFRVRLPAGAQLAPSTGTAYTVAEIAAEGEPQGEGRLVEVRLHEKTPGPVQVRLAARRELVAGVLGQWIELAGFQVLGAVRQSGHLAIEVGDDLDVLWDPKFGIQQTEDLPEGLSRDEVVAGFEYFTQPCSLRALVAGRQTRISVEPRYVAVVDAEEVRLEAVLDYTVRGKKARVLDIELGDWQYDQVGPDNLVEADRAVQGSAGRLSIPLCQPTSGKIEVRLKAHRRRDRGEEMLRLTFPQPQATTSTPATIVISPEDCVEMTVDAKETKGLTRQQQIAAGEATGGRQQAPVLYRGDPAGAVFAARCRVHAGRVAVSSSTTVMLKQPVFDVRQVFSYKIDYEPLDSLLLEIPPALEGSTRLEFWLGGERVPAAGVSSDRSAEPSAAGGARRVRLALGRPRIGTCDLEVRFSLDAPLLVPRSCIRTAVPLVVPLDGELASNRLRAITSPELAVSLVGGPWKDGGDAASQQSSDAGKAGSTTEFVADGRVSDVRLGLSLEARETARGTIVHRALVQTWLRHDARQDRAVFRFTSREPSAFLVVPRGESLAKVSAYLDGKPVAARPAGGRTLQIELSQASSAQPRLLEVWSESVGPQTLRGRQTIDLPRLREGAWIRRMYWQLTLPSNEHVVNAPTGLAREFRWGWNGLFWGRQSLLQTQDLEDWVGVTEDPSLGSGNDSYLFSAFGSPGTAEVMIVGRSWIVLGASGGALVIGLLLIYVPASRHPAGLFVAAVALGGAALVYPEPALLVLQAASLGLALVLMAGLLDRSVARRRRERITLEMPGSSILKESTQAQYRTVAASAGDAADAPPSAQRSSGRAASLES